MYSFIITASVLAIGTFGLHVIEDMSYIDSFYFMSMLATTEGPPIAPHTFAGKIFASIMAFISIGAVVASLAFIFGPLFGTLLRIGVHEIEKEIHEIEK